VHIPTETMTQFEFTRQIIRPDISSRAEPVIKAAAMRGAEWPTEAQPPAFSFST